MIDRDEAETLLEDQGHLFTGAGDDAGPLVRVYLDEYTGWPSFCTITSDRAGRETLVALHEAEHHTSGAVSGVRVPYDQDKLDSAPTVADDQDLTVSEEDALFEYYDVPIEGIVPSVEHLGSVLVPHDHGQPGGPDVVEHDVSNPPG